MPWSLLHCDHLFYVTMQKLLILSARHCHNCCECVLRWMDKKQHAKQCIGVTWCNHQCKGSTRDLTMLNSSSTLRLDTPVGPRLGVLSGLPAIFLWAAGATELRCPSTIFFKIGNNWIGDASPWRTVWLHTDYFNAVSKSSKQNRLSRLAWIVPFWWRASINRFSNT